MNRKNSGAIIVLLCLALFLLTPSLRAEEQFQPTYYFTGKIQLIANSYFGKYPLNPVVEIPEGITDPEELAEWEAKKREDTAIRNTFRLCNPTVPGISQSIELEFYANPVPDLEAIIDMGHRGMWGGSGSEYELTSPLFLKEAYARYYSENAMYTIGRFSYELGPLGLLLGHPNGAKEGVLVHTMMKDTWITFAYNRLLMSLYPDYPYVSSYLLDDLVALRLSRTVGENNLVGFNLIANGFYDEIGLSVDYNGKLWGKTAVAELAVIYPAWVFRDLFPDHAWPGGIVSVNLIENLEHILTLRVGALSKGFISQYGVKGMSGMEQAIKFYPNTGGIDLVYQRGLSEDLIFGANLYAATYLDCSYQIERKARYDMRILEVKLQKYLSEVSDIRLSTALLNNDKDTYGKVELSWNFTF